MASEKEAIPKDDSKEEEAAKGTNGEKNGDSAEVEDKQKLSLGEIAAIEKKVAEAKTEQLQVLHNLFYGKNGTAPQIKRGIRKFAGFEEGDKQKKLEQILTYELAAIKQTATVLDLQDIKKDDTKDSIAGAIIDFLMFPTGKTVEEVQNDEPEEEEAEEEEEEEEEEVKPKGKKGRGGNANSGSRPKRATASRVWTNDYGSSEEEEIVEARPRVGRKKRGADESDDGSEYNPSGGGSDSEGDRRKSARNTVPARPTRGRRGRDSESEEESESEDLSEDEVPAKKKKQPATSNRTTPKRGAAQKGRKRKQDTSEEEVSEDESVEEGLDSDDSEKKKSRKTATPKSSPQKSNSKGRPKRAAPPAKKKRKDASSEDEEEPELSEEDDDEPLKKPPTKKGSSADGAPTDDDIKKLLKDILAEANLEEITMKTVCKKVYAHYPNHDLSQRKDFIKQTVKSLIAA